MKRFHVHIAVEKLDDSAAGVSRPIPQAVTRRALYIHWLLPHCRA
jgi:hypothetical protein